MVVDGQPVLDRLEELDEPPGSEYAGYDHELQRSMIESRTEVCGDLDEVRAQLRRLRADLVRSAAEEDRWVVAAGTLPLGDWWGQRITPKARYERIAELHQYVARQQIVCGCHVHVGISDQDTAIEVLNRARVWLPALLALSGSSPFWMGVDTGYASYRTIVWRAWPSSGIPQAHESAAAYWRVVRSLIDTGTMLDAGQVYWDIRLGNKTDTLEFRTADACTTLDEAVMQSGLCRALARTCLDQVGSGRPPPAVRQELLVAAHWRAARSGLEDTLVDVVAGEAVPAAELLDRFLAYLRPALEEAGDWDEVSALVEQARRRGTSAQRQRRAFAKTQRLEDVVDLLRVETASDLQPQT